MTASDKINTLIKDAKKMHPSTRWLAYQEIARDFGDGFAAVVRQKVEESERKSGQRKGDK